MRIRSKRAFSISGHILTALAVLSLIANPATAADEEWQPPLPMPEKFDWIQMASLEWLKGEIIAMYDDSMEFDSKEFDLQTVDWKDVKEVRSVGTMQVAFEDGTIAIGQLFIDQKTVRVMGDKDREFPRSGLLSITPGSPKEINNWSIKASIGANLRGGNTEQVETTGKAALVRRTPTDRINIDWLSVFNKTDGESAADNQRASAGWNHYFTKRFYWSPVYGEWFRDPFVNISSRYTIGMGAGYEVVDTKKISWDLTGGLGYQYTQFDSVADGEPDTANTPALLFGTNYDHDLTKWMEFLFSFSFQILNEESGTYTHHLETGLEFELTKILDFDFTFIWDRIQNPRPDALGIIPEQDDYRLVFFLGFDL